MDKKTKMFVATVLQKSNESKTNIEQEILIEKLSLAISELMPLFEDEILDLLGVPNENCDQMCDVLNGLNKGPILPDQFCRDCFTNEIAEIADMEQAMDFVEATLEYVASEECQAIIRAQKGKANK